MGERMTLTQLIWKIERWIIKAKCGTCKYHILNSCTRLPNCLYCQSNVRVRSFSNCMYYEKSKW